MRRLSPAPLPLSDVCLNCGASIASRFCGECGQENEPAAPSFSALIADLWQEFLQLDGKVLRTLWFLLSRPGFLSAEYVSGRRIRYVSPFRLYFWATALFVLLFYKLNVIDTEELQRVTQKAERIAQAELASTRADSKPVEKNSRPKPTTRPLPEISIGESSKKSGPNHISLSSAKDLKSDAMGQVYSELLPVLSTKGAEIFGVRINPTALPKTVFEYHDAQDALPKNERDDLKRRFVTERVIRAKNNPFELVRSLVGGALPNILILCVPIWAVMLKLFFRRRLYIEHVVFALHTHIFAIFLFGLRLSFEHLTGMENAGTRIGPLVVLIGYNFLAGLRFYRERPVVTLVKGAGLSCGYGCILIFAATLGLLITLIATFLNL